MSEHIFTRNLVNGEWDLHNCRKVDSEGNQIYLDSDIQEDIPDKPFRIRMSGTEVKIIFDDELDAAETSQLALTVEDHRNYDANLAYLKDSKIVEIDDRTVELIYQGFAFDGESFSLSERSQINWVALKTLENVLTFPVAITTKNDGEYSLTAANLTSFVSTAAGVKQGHLDSGRALKMQVVSATDQTELDAVVDNR